MEESLGARLLRHLKEVGELAGIKTEEYARVGRKRFEALGLERESAKEKRSLGERVFELAERAGEGDVLGDVTVQALIERIRKLNAEMASCEQKIEVLSRTAAERARDVRARYRAESEAEGSAGTGGGAAARAEAGKDGHPDGKSD